MRPFLVALICVCALVTELGAADSNSHAWRKFKRDHAKSYAQEEEAARFANFLANKALVERHNADPHATFKMRLNHMADWSSEEFQRINGFRAEAAREWAEQSAGKALPARLAELLDGPIPKEVDWRKVPNRVGSVKNQGQCGSCWAFATTGLLEGQQVFKNFSAIIPLSEQELIDCSYQNEGCDGGLMKLALEDIADDIGGIESEKDYPYKADDTDCRISTKKVVMQINGGHFLKQGDERALLMAVANYGPVAVSMDATKLLMHYHSGVLNDSTCIKDAPNHGVLIVGYGHDAKFGDFWIVKNSWGLEWGEKGYFRIKRGVNMCGVADFATLADL